MSESDRALVLAFVAEMRRQLNETMIMPYESHLSPRKVAHIRAAINGVLQEIVDNMEETLRMIATSGRDAAIRAITHRLKDQYTSNEKILLDALEKK